MKKLLTFLVFSSFLISCEKQPLSLQKSKDEAIIGGYDYRRCDGCGGHFISINNIRLRFDENLLSKKDKELLENRKTDTLTTRWSFVRYGYSDEIIIHKFYKN